MKVPNHGKRRPGCSTAQRKEQEGTGVGVHASGERPRGYLLLHSAFGPSSMQLERRQSQRGGGRGETQNTGEERDPARPGYCDGSERR